MCICYNYISIKARKVGSITGDLHSFLYCNPMPQSLPWFKHTTCCIFPSQFLYHLQWITQIPQLPSFHSLLCHSTQLSPALPRTPRITPDREAGRLIPDFHLSPRLFQVQFLKLSPRLVVGQLFQFYFPPCPSSPNKHTELPFQYFFSPTNPIILITKNRRHYLRTTDLSHL